MNEDVVYIRSLPDMAFHYGYVGLVFGKERGRDEWFLWAEPELLATLAEARNWKSGREDRLADPFYNREFHCVVYSLEVVPPMEKSDG